MQPLTSTGHDLLATVARRHGFSTEAASGMLDSVVRGGGSMAQFSHPEFGGSGQWMRGGMTMVSDMFNHSLKSRVDALCTELAARVAAEPAAFETSGAAPSPRQPTGMPAAFRRPRLVESVGSGDWWPADLRWPNSTGAQNGMRYAYFAQAHRLVIDQGGTITVYDTLDHQIAGAAQQQSRQGTLSFQSQFGLVDLATLPVVSVDGEAAEPEVLHTIDDVPDDDDAAAFAALGDPGDAPMTVSPPAPVDPWVSAFQGPASRVSGE